jgi:serine phosphatase RsbU (regulator of sigma subunit)
MEETTDRINRALAREETRAERVAGTVRLIALLIFACVELLNVGSLSIEASIMNGSVLLAGCMYGFMVLIWIRRRGYHPAMKYVTSCLDVVLIFLLLFMYTRIEIPSVALKNYVFLAVFPIIALTAFRYDRMLTLTSGGLAIALYLSLIFYLHGSKSISFTHGGYEQELFSPAVTYVGQLTKVSILVGFVIIVAYFAEYSRRLFVKLVQEESNLRYQKDLTDWELRVASEVQTKLLPHSFPEIEKLDVFAAVRQGRLVGGDYCDILKLNDHLVLLVTADVSGKGVPAALIMAEVRASIQLLAPLNIPLEDLTQRLNTLLYQSTTKKDFVTFFVAEIDTRHRTLRYVNAGHPPPLVYSKGDFRSLSQRTIPLGLYPTLPQLAMGEEEFTPGCLFLSFTDGLLEQTDVRREQYGEERLRMFVQTNADLAVQPFTLALLNELTTFGQGKEFNDDVGIAVAKFHTIPAA